MPGYPAHPDAGTGPGPGGSDTPGHPGPRLAFSGWLASGKDTVAREVYERLGVPSRQASMAHAIKAELTDLIQTATRSPDDRSAIEAVCASTGASADQVTHVLDVLADGRAFDAARGALSGLTGWDRTAEVRRALQYWGTDVRRGSDPSYWVDRAVDLALTSLGEGVVPYFTDVRFPDEADGLRSIGYRVVRVTVTRETQTRRLASRDGIAPDRAALEHPSETALDGYDGFDLVVDNDGPLDATVQRILRDLA